MSIGRNANDMKSPNSQDDRISNMFVIGYKCLWYTAVLNLRNGWTDDSEDFGLSLSILKTTDRHDLTFTASIGKLFPISIVVDVKGCAFNQTWSGCVSCSHPLKIHAKVKENTIQTAVH